MIAFLAFESRMHELLRGWRSQGRDVELQLARYADGLFSNMERQVRPLSVLSVAGHVVHIAHSSHLAGIQAQGRVG